MLDAPFTHTVIPRPNEATHVHARRETATRLRTQSGSVYLLSGAMDAAAAAAAGLPAADVLCERFA